MKRIPFDLPLYVLFLALPFLVSCGGPGARKSPSGSMPVSMGDTLPIPNDWFAPLFYDGQLCHWVRTIFQDHRGDLWFGTNHYGAIRYSGDTLEYLADNVGIRGGRVSVIMEDAAGNVWLSADGGLTRYDGHTFTNHPIGDDPIRNEIWDMHIDRAGRFWVATTGGAHLFDGQRFAPFPLPKAQVSDTNAILSPDRITCILEDRHGILWFGTDGFGICRYDPSIPAGPGSGKAFTQLTGQDGLCDNTISDLFEDARGNVWIATMFGGISRYDGTTFTNPTADGDVTGQEAGGFFEDAEGHVWFAAENHGVYRYDPEAEGKPGAKAFTRFHEKEGLFTNGILSILEDKQGRFWFGGWKGLFRFDGKTFRPVTKKGPWK